MDCFNGLMSKIIKKIIKKQYFYSFPSIKNFEKQLLLYFQIPYKE